MATRILCLLVALAPLARAELGAADKKKVRVVLTALLAETKPKERAKLIASLADLDAPLEDIEAAVRMGPLYRDGAPPVSSISF